ncbi:MAG: TolC family protein [Flavobacteriales bacterium]
MKNLTVIILSFSLALISSGLSAQEELTLEQAQEYALKNAYSVKAALLDLKKVEEQVKETKAIGLPQINAEGSFQNFLDIPVQVIPDFISPAVFGTLLETGVLPSDSPQPEATFVEAQFGTEFNAGLGITASQLIYDGSYLIGLKAVRGVRELTAVQIEKSEEEIKVQIADAYHLCLAADENIKILNESSGVLEKTLSDTRALYENGFVEEQDVEQLELSIRSLSNQIQNAENQKTIAYELLKFQMGLEQNIDIRLTSEIEALVNSAVSSGLVNTEVSIDQDVDYRLALTNRNLQELQMKNEKAAYQPSLGAFFNYQTNALRNEFNFFDGDQPWFPTTVWGLNLNIPIFSSGMRKSRVQQAKIEIERADLFIKQAKEGATMELKSTRNDMTFAVDNYQTSLESKDLAKRIYDKTQIKYNEGISSSFELTQAKNQYLETQGQYVSAVLNLLNSANALNEALNNY